MQRINLDATSLKRREHPIQASGYFQKIVFAALDRDQKVIDDFFKKEFFTLDVKLGRSYGLITPAGLLEKLGEHEAVNFLLKNGADVDYAGFGAAISGNRPRAEYLRKYRGASPTAIARGAACLGDVFYAKYLYVNYGADAFDIILGFIMAREYKEAIEFIESFWIDLPYNRGAEFWKAVGIAAGEVTPDIVAVWKSFKRNNRAEIAEPSDLYNIYHGAGLSGLYDISPDADEGFKSSFYRGAIHGNHNEDLPEILYKAKAQNDEFDRMYDLTVPIDGCNIDFMERCLEVNKGDTAARKEFYEWAYYKISISTDIQLMRNIPPHSNMLVDLIKYGYRLPEFDHYNYHLSEQSFKSLSFIFKTRNQKIFDINLSGSEFLNLLRNEKIATHLMAFDDNDAFQRKLLEKFDGIKWNNWLEPYYYDLHKVYAKASKIKVLMKKYHFNYDQSLALIESEDLRSFILNTCNDITKYIHKDICALIVSELGNITPSDSSNLLDKVKRYRYTIRDILQIAGELDAYAATHISDQAAHATSLAHALTATKTAANAVELLQTELKMLENARELSQPLTWNNYALLGKSAVSFFNATARKARNLYGTDPVPAHQQPYEKMTVDESYEGLVTSSMQALLR